MTRRAGHTVLVLFLAVIVTGWVWAEDTQSPDGKGFWVEETKIDAGTVKAGGEVEAVFVFHNDTDAEVKILKAKPT